MMINVDAVVIIMLIGRYHYVFAEATHGSHSGRSRMGRKVLVKSIKHRRADEHGNIEFLVEWTGIG